MMRSNGNRRSGAEATLSSNPNAEAILDTAEELFAQKGFAGVTMRLIASESGQHLASANYYFGSKNGLFEASFLRNIVPVNRRRSELLEQTIAAKTPTLADIVEAYIRPLFERKGSAEAGSRARLIMLFSKQLLSNPDEHKYLQSYYEDVARQFIEAICKYSPDIVLADAIWGYNYMVGVLVFTLAGKAPNAKLPDEFLTQIDTDEPDEITIDRLCRFICAGLNAFRPVSPV